MIGFYLDDINMDFVDQTGNTYLIMFSEAFKDETADDFEDDSELIEYLYNRDKNITMSDEMLKQAIDDIDRYDKSLTLMRSQYRRRGTNRSSYLNTLFKSPNKNLDEKDVSSAITSWNSTGNIALQTPIYPYPIDLNGYDFTINALHVSLYDILLSNTFVYNKNIRNSQETNNKIEFIDFNWHTKVFNFNVKDIKNKSNAFDLITNVNNGGDNENNINNNSNNNNNNNNNDYVYSDVNLIADYNHLGLEHLDSKILTMPCLDALNITTAPFYFWRFVKICEKFIDKLQADIWYIDPDYLEWTIYFYDFWFYDLEYEYTTLDTLKKTFIRKLLKWHVNADKINSSNTNKNQNVF